jgi:hypothetical protein
VKFLKLLADLEVQLTEGESLAAVARDNLKKLRAGDEKYIFHGLE